MIATGRDMLYGLYLFSCGRRMTVNDFTLAYYKAWDIAAPPGSLWPLHAVRATGNGKKAGVHAPPATRARRETSAGSSGGSPVSRWCCTWSRANTPCNKCLFRNSLPRPTGGEGSGVRGRGLCTSPHPNPSPPRGARGLWNSHKLREVSMRVSRRPGGESPR